MRAFLGDMIQPYHVPSFVSEACSCSSKKHSFGTLSMTEAPSSMLTELIKVLNLGRLVVWSELSYIQERLIIGFNYLCHILPYGRK